MYVFEGLENGQVAIYSKVHHAAVDGQAGVALAKALFDLSPEPRQIRPPRARQRSNQYQLGFAELATAAIQNTMQQYIKLITTLPNAMSTIASVAIPAFANMTKMPTFSLPNLMQPNMGLSDLKDSNFGLPAGMGFGPRTPLNVSITNQRAFAGRTVSLAETKAAAKRAGVSLNDMVMAACADALRRYMADLNVPLDKSLTAAIPVSLRDAGNTDPNNQVTMMLASLATDVKDPLERLKAIHASTTASKELTGSFKAAIPTDFPSFGAPWIMTSIATLFGRSKLTDQMPPMANVAISNVPGVPVPLYIAGAKMATYFPVSIPAHGCALNITVQSYNGQLDYGLTACRRAVPDVDDIADAIVRAHAELNRLVMAAPQSAASKPTAAAVSAAPPATDQPARLPSPSTDGANAPIPSLHRSAATPEPVPVSDIATGGPHRATAATAQPIVPATKAKRASTRAKTAKAKASAANHVAGAKAGRGAAQKSAVPARAAPAAVKKAPLKKAQPAQSAKAKLKTKPRAR